MRVVIVVEGGFVRDVYAETTASVNVEVLDIDEPGCVDDEEYDRIEAMCRRAESLSDDPSFVCVY